MPPVGTVDPLHRTRDILFLQGVGYIILKETKLFFLRQVGYIHDVSRGQLEIQASSMLVLSFPKGHIYVDHDRDYYEDMDCVRRWSDVFDVVKANPDTLTVVRILTSLPKLGETEVGERPLEAYCAVPTTRSVRVTGRAGDNTSMSLAELNRLVKAAGGFPQKN
jgi:hypothetical protein